MKMLFQKDKVWQNKRNFFQNINSPTFNIRRKHIEKFIPAAVSESPTALDVGCGFGTYIPILVKKGYKVTAFDKSQYAVSIIKQNNKLKGVNTIICSSLEDFNTELKYDFILCSEILEHIKDDFTMFRKIAGFLKPEGKILVSVPNIPSLFGSSDINSGHFRRYSRKRCRSLVKKGSLNLTHIMTYGFPLLRLYWSFRKIFNFNSNNKKSKKKHSRKRLLFFLASKILNYIFYIDFLFPDKGHGVGIIFMAEKPKIKN